MLGLFPSEYNCAQHDQSGTNPTAYIQFLSEECDRQRHCYDDAELIDRSNLGNLPNLKRTKVAEPGEACTEAG